MKPKRGESMNYHQPFAEAEFSVYLVLLDD